MDLVGVSQGSEVSLQAGLTLLAYGMPEIDDETASVTAKGIRS